MNLNLIGYTKIPNHSNEFVLQEALEYCAKIGGVCYMKDSFDILLNEPIDTTTKRLNQVLTSGHHSVFDHFKLNFEISGISKILAMILNNEKDYATSEKSARYTKFTELPEAEKALYFKWYDKLQVIIKEKYPNLRNENAKNPDLKIQKLAQENARYFVSVFTPATTIVYTTSLRQINYIIYMLKDFVDTCEDTEFNRLLAPQIKEFISLFDKFIVEDLIPKGKNRKLSLFGNEKYIDVPDVFSYVYQTTFKASYACMAQNHRHRSEHSFMYNLEEFEFYVPEILEDEHLIKEWLQDAKSIKDIYPQGRLIKIVQTGNIDTLLLKATERVCGAAQLEIMRHTTNLLSKFNKNSIYSDTITNYTNNKKAKCQFKNATCGGACMLGINQFDRKI